MLTREQRRKIVYERLDLISVETRESMDRLSYADSSRGMVLQYGGTGGGHSGRTPDLTSAAAILSASESNATKNARAWRGLVSSLYADLLRPDVETEYQMKHRRLLAWIVFERVLLGKKFSEIAGKEIYAGAHLSLSCLSRYFSEILDLCVDLAVDRGLIP